MADRFLIQNSKISSDETKTAKADLRTRCLQERAELAASQEKYKKMNANICHHLRGVVDAMGFERLFLYISFRGEPDVLSGCLKFLGNRALISIPRITSYKNGLMDFYPYDPEQLEENKWGLTEPKVAGGVVVPTSKDLVVLPSVAVDMSARRLGYGGGFYDRMFVEKASGYRVLVCFDQFFFSEVPSNSWDLVADGVVTDKNVLLTS